MLDCLFNAFLRNLNIIVKIDLLQRLSRFFLHLYFGVFPSFLDDFKNFVGILGSKGKSGWLILNGNLNVEIFVLLDFLFIVLEKWWINSKSLIHGIHFPECEFIDIFEKDLIFSVLRKVELQNSDRISTNFNIFIFVEKLILLGIYFRHLY